MLQHLSIIDSNLDLSVVTLASFLEDLPMMALRFQGFTKDIGFRKTSSRVFVMSNNILVSSIPGLYLHIFSFIQRTRLSILV